MDVKRITSALLGFPLVVIIFLIGNKYIVDALIAIVAILGMFEYFKAISKVCKPVKWLGYLSCLSIAFIHVIPNAWLTSVVTLSVPTILLILFLNIIITDMRINFKDIAYTFIGIFYIVFFMNPTDYFPSLCRNNFELSGRIPLLIFTERTRPAASSI